MPQLANDVHLAVWRRSLQVGMPSFSSVRLTRRCNCSTSWMAANVLHNLFHRLLHRPGFLSCLMRNPLPCLTGAATRHAKYAGRRRGTDRFWLCHPGTEVSVVC